MMYREDPHQRVRDVLVFATVLALVGGTVALVWKAIH